MTRHCRCHGATRCASFVASALNPADYKVVLGTFVDGGAFVTTLPSLAVATDKLASQFSRTRVCFISAK